MLKKLSNRKVVIIGFALLFIILALTIVIAIGYGYCKSDIKQTDSKVFDLSEDKNAEQGIVIGKSKEEVQNEVNKKVAEGMISIFINSNPVFENGLSEGNFLISNPKDNRYPQVVEIYREDTNELIYKSGGIKVGSKIENAKLSTNLPKGSYKCMAYINSVDEQTKEGRGTVRAKLIITVLN